MTLDEAYEIIHRDDSDMLPNLDALEKAVIDADARTVIELGVRGGVSTVALLSALKITGGGLWSIDVSWPVGPWQSALMNNPNWYFYRGDDLSPPTYWPTEADIVFIDTSHAYDHTLKELGLYWHHLKPGGRFLLHDTELEKPELVGEQPPFPVKKAALEFAEFMGLVFMNDPTGYGLGSIRV